MLGAPRPSGNADTRFVDEALLFERGDSGHNAAAGAVPCISVHYRALELVAPVIGAEIVWREDHIAVRRQELH
jgi:hypothetical protein